VFSSKQAESSYLFYLQQGSLKQTLETIGTPIESTALFNS
jgi:hypothetical protein